VALGWATGACQSSSLPAAGADGPFDDFRPGGTRSLLHHFRRFAALAVLGLRPRTFRERAAHEPAHCGIAAAALVAWRSSGPRVAEPQVLAEASPRLKVGALRRRPARRRPEGRRRRRRAKNRLEDPSEPDQVGPGESAPSTRRPIPEGRRRAVEAG
jgi:hypothetical protein